MLCSTGTSTSRVNIYSWPTMAHVQPNIYRLILLAWSPTLHLYFRYIQRPFQCCSSFVICNWLCPLLLIPTHHWPVGDRPLIRSGWKAIWNFSRARVLCHLVADNLSGYIPAMQLQPLVFNWVVQNFWVSVVCSVLRIAIHVLGRCPYVQVVEAIKLFLSLLLAFFGYGILESLRVASLWLNGGCFPFDRLINGIFYDISSHILPNI